MIKAGNPIGHKASAKVTAGIQAVNHYTVKHTSEQEETKTNLSRVANLTAPSQTCLHTTMKLLLHL